MSGLAGGSESLKGVPCRVLTWATIMMACYRQPAGLLEKIGHAIERSRLVQRTSELYSHNKYIFDSHIYIPNITTPFRWSVNRKSRHCSNVILYCQLLLLLYIVGVWGFL